MRFFVAPVSLGDIFLTLLDDIVEISVKFTNLYAAQKKRKQWTILTEREFFAFLAIIIYFGRMGLSRSTAWRPYPYGNDYVKGLMTGRRFSDIYACLHFLDNETVSAEAKARDCFWQIRPMFNTLNRTWKKFYVPSRKIGIDEQVVNLVILGSILYSL